MANKIGGYYYWRVRCRCRKKGCEKRVTLRKRPEQYVREPLCAVCGSKLRVDHYRQSKRERRDVRCSCGARPWKHTRGAYCRTYKAPMVEPLTAAQLDELGVLA